MGDQIDRGDERLVLKMDNSVQIIGFHMYISRVRGHFYCGVWIGEKERPERVLITNL